MPHYGRGAVSQISRKEGRITCEAGYPFPSFLILPFSRNRHGTALCDIYWSMSRIGRKKEQLADTLKLPRDMVLGESILTMTGNHELWIENYKGIIEYTPKSIILQAKTGQISICGCGLAIDYYTSEDMKIVGEIRCVSCL